MNDTTLLKFSIGNAKLMDNEGIFDLPAGHSCMFAKECFAFANRETGRITDGAKQEFRCYAASMEIFPNIRNFRWHNFDLLKDCKTQKEMRDLIIKSLPSLLRYRIHSSGDFFSLDYLRAWIDVARKYPNRTFYCYTKALPFVLKCKNIPVNFVITASYGGTHDNLIEKKKMKYAKVVSSKYEAKKLGLEIDHDDSHAWKNNKSFSILLHGNGKIGTRQAMLQNAKAWAGRRAAKLANDLTPA